MRAVRISAPGTADLVELPRPEPADGEVLVRVAAAAICGTDRKLAARGTSPPRVPGHEVAGHTSDGTPVGVHPDIGCGRCERCRQGLTNRCPSRVSVGIARDGGLAEWLAIPARQTLPLGPVPLPIAPLLEPLACAVHAVTQVGLAPGDRALVVGAGAMGVLCTWVLQGTGATVAVCQRSEPRRGLARRLGADVVLGPDDDPAALLGEPPHGAIVTAPGAGPLVWSLERVRAGGTVHAFAGTPGGAPVDANLIHYRHLTLLGSTGSTLDDYRRAHELVSDGRIDLHRLPHRWIGLGDAPGALTRDEGDPSVLRTLITMGEEKR